MFRLQSHRGARGLMPENTLQAFAYSLECGVCAMEFDLVVSADKQLVVSHEAWFSAQISTTPDGKPILPDEEHRHNIYQMAYQKVRQYDCGQRQHPAFQQQETMPAFKPLFSEMVHFCDTYAEILRLPLPLYNIEIKTEGQVNDGIFQPPPDEFAELVCRAIYTENIADRCIVQSFDERIVQAVKRLDKCLPLSLLVENDASLEENLDRLGFLPQYYSPYYGFINPELVEKVHALSMHLMTWTVNEFNTIKQLRNWGVDEVITDYPNLIRQLND